MSTMPPVMPTPEEQAAKEAAQVIKRAAQLKRLATLPAHLRLGVTLPGMRELLSQLPSDAVEQVNLHNAKFPPNDTENGYVNQFFIALWAKEGKEGKPGDGLAAGDRQLVHLFPAGDEVLVGVAVDRPAVEVLVCGYLGVDLLHRVARQL